MKQLDIELYHSCITYMISNQKKTCSLDQKTRQQQKIPQKTSCMVWPTEFRRWPCWWPCPIPAPTWVSRVVIEDTQNWRFVVGDLYIWVFSKIVGFPPSSSIFLGFSMIFTIHFGCFPYFWKHPYRTMEKYMEQIRYWHWHILPFQNGKSVFFNSTSIFISYIFVKKVTTISRDEVAGSF